MYNTKFSVEVKNKKFSYLLSYIWLSGLDNIKFNIKSDKHFLLKLLNSTKGPITKWAITK
jgi:hypothetical protein